MTVGQLTQMTRREPARRHRRRTRYGNLSRQAELLVVAMSWSDSPLYRSSPASPAINTPFTANQPA